MMGAKQSHFRKVGRLATQCLGGGHAPQSPSHQRSEHSEKLREHSKKLHAERACKSSGMAAPPATAAAAEHESSVRVRMQCGSKGGRRRRARDDNDGEHAEPCDCAEEFRLAGVEEGARHERDVDTDQVDLWGPHLYGARKFLGGASSKDGRFCFGVPAHADYILRLDTTTGEVVRLAQGVLPAGQFKWLRGVRAHNGNIYCIPACAPCVVKIVPETGEVTMFGHEVCKYGEWQWHGAALSDTDGNIYAIPANAKQVLRIEPETDTVSLHGPELDEGGVKAKWYGGIKGRDGSIWGVPYNAGCCLKIKPASAPGMDDVEVTCIGSFPRGGWKWHGGTADCVTGAIWGIPSHADGVLKIVPEEERAEVVDMKGVIPDASVGSKYKWGGAVCDSKGIVWCVPSDADFVLKVTPGKDGSPDTLECVRGDVDDYKNKYQGGVLVKGGGDGGGDAVYCIPCDATNVLKIHTATHRLEPLGRLPGNLKKFQGAYYSPDGTIWGLPESARHILRIRPVARPSASDQGAGTFHKK